MDGHGGGLLADPKFWIAVSFTIFVALFGGRLLRTLVAMLDKRSAAIQTELDEASRLRREADAMLQDATLRLQAATKEAADLVQYARAEAARLAEAARTDAATSAARRERMALDRIGAAEKAAVTEVRLAAADIAARAARQVIAETLSPDADAALVDRAIAGLPSALSGRRAA